MRYAPSASSAVELRQTAPAVIVDAHNDLLLELVLRRDERPLELVLRRGEERLFERYWLAKLEAGGVGVQICPLYAATAPREKALEGDPGAFEEWFGRGVRTASLTWNHANEFAGGIDTPTEGLTDRGRTLVRRFRELGVVLDLAHASQQTWRDVLEEELPFSVTHAGCRTVRDHPRNLADWQLEALAARGGVLGMMALAFVVDPEAPTLSRWLDHVDHAVAVMGVEHVGLGADFIDQVADVEREHGLDEASPAVAELAGAKARLGLEGFTGPDDYPALVDALKGRGYDGEWLEAILSGNWLRVLGESLPSL
jgi:membrane dipeptidase